MTNYFSDDSIIRLRGSSRTDSTNFVVVQKLNEGNSVVCYKARCAAKSGILRAFKNPSDLKNFRFIIEERARNDAIKSFIPAVEIFFDDKALPYVWCEEPLLKTFDEICADFQKEVQPNAAYNLTLLLSAAKNLTQCICELHKAGLIHRDIKPANFGFLRRGGDILTQTVSLFDADTICSVFDEQKEIVGTPGFSELSIPADNLSDIFSIGATIFFALSGKPFREEFLTDMKKVVDSSPLISNLIYPHPKLKASLLTVLQKSLCPRPARYRDCEELLNDLDSALYFALPLELAYRLDDKDFSWNDFYRFLEERKGRDFTTLLRYHLYKVPLYLCREAQSSHLNVLICGCGDYAQRFLDTCLTLAQMPGTELSATVVANNPDDFELYLTNRPALKDFFAINDNEPSKESYGHISFEQQAFSDNEDDNEKILENFFCRANELPSYIFFALGKNHLNLSAAKACREAANILNHSCIISFAWEGTHHFDSLAENVFPVLIDADPKDFPFHDDLERMAFNAHLIWKKNLQLDYEQIRAEFLEPYNHNSCLLNVISLKYKLKTLGLDTDKRSPQECAETFLNLLNDETNRHIEDELIYFEHRRWVTEKICDGWIKRDVKACADGVTQDKDKKNHVCIVRSRPDRLLKEKFGDHPEKWNSTAALDNLDELDRMSVELHRVYSQRAKSAREENILNGDNVTALLNFVGSNKAALTALNDWLSCMWDIWNGNRRRLNVCQSLRDTFKDSIKALSAGNIVEAMKHVDALDDDFAIIRNSMTFRNYKLDDENLIRYAPFILTYSEKIILAIPYEQNPFKNIAANSFVNAQSVLYLLMAEDASQLTDLKTRLSSDLPGLFKYVAKKNLRAKFEFVIFCTDKISVPLREDFAEIFGGFEAVKALKWFLFQTNEDIPKIVANCLEEYRESDCLLALERNSSRLSAFLSGGNVYRHFDNYSFDLNKQEFSTSENCRLLSYIKKPVSLSTTDLFVLKNSNVYRHEKPEFFGDYEKLWKIYRQNSTIWKKLCDWLAKETSPKLVAIFQKAPVRSDAKIFNFRYIIPIECKIATEKLLSELKRAGCIKQTSRVVVKTPTSCIVIVNTDDYARNVRDNLNKIFTNPYVLMNADALLITDKNFELTVSFDDLIVSNLYSAEDRHFETLLRNLAKIGYLTNFEKVNGVIKFTYPTLQIKKLLTKAGKLLEIFVYHKLVASGLFDDVTSGCEISWRDTDAASEIDCVVTKGFRSIFIECKARTILKQEFYFRLGSLAQHFGTNAQTVLISDTNEEFHQEAVSNNEIQRQRGNLQNVITIWHPDEIDNIDKTLAKLL